MSMIRPAKFSLGLEDDVIDADILDTVPFPVTFKLHYAEKQLKVLYDK
jgi:hypothetical protein